MLICAKFDVIVERIKLQEFLGADAALVDSLAVQQAVVSSDMSSVCIATVEN